MGTEEVDKRQGLIALKISKNSPPSELIDKKLLDRAMELHREIKTLSKLVRRLKDERLVILEENRDLRKRLEELEKTCLNDYQDH